VEFWWQRNYSYWTDYQLKWDPKEYGGIDRVPIPSSKVWTPDIVLFNNADGKFEPSYIPNAVMSSTGYMTYLPTAIYTSSCGIDVEYFPFDQQVCEMHIGSWTFRGSTLKYSLQYSQIDLAPYASNGAWDLIDCPGAVINVTDPVTQEEREMMVFKLVLRRKTLFYTVNLVIPCFLHTIACLCVFWLPSDGCEKITLVISVLVSVVVLLLVMQKILPPSKTVPLIAKYYMFSFVMNVFEILITVATIYANHVTPRTAVMPHWAAWLFLYKLPLILKMERPDHDKRWNKTDAAPPSLPSCFQISKGGQVAQGSQTSSDIAEGTLNGEDKNTVRRRVQTDSVTPPRPVTPIDYKSTKKIPTSPKSSGPSQSHDLIASQPHDLMTSQSHDSLAAELSHAQKTAGALPGEVHEASAAIKFICQQMHDRQDYKDTLDDWKYLAAVMDRLLMVVYVLVMLSGTAAILLNAPYIMEVIDQGAIIKEINYVNNPTTTAIPNYRQTT